MAAREQQLREKELTLAFDLAQANALKRLRLRLKLEDLHPEPTTRKQLEAELSALNAGESRAVAAMRHSNAAVLADYRLQVEHDTARAGSQMAAQLQAKAAANLALRRKALYGEVIPSQLVGGEAPDAGAMAVAGEFAARAAIFRSDSTRSRNRHASRSFKQPPKFARSSKSATRSANRSSPKFFARHKRSCRRVISRASLHRDHAPRRAST